MLYGTFVAVCGFVLAVHAHLDRREYPFRDLLVQASANAAVSTGVLAVPLGMAMGQAANIDDGNPTWIFGAAGAIASSAAATWWHRTRSGPRAEPDTVRP